MRVASTTFGLLMLPDAFTFAARLPESGCPAKPEAAASRGSSRARSAASLSSPASGRLPLPVRSIAAPLKASSEICTDLPVSKDALRSSRGSRPSSSAAPGGRPCKAAVRSARTASIVPAPSPIVTSDPRSILPSIGGREVGSGIAAATSGRSAGTSRSSRSRPAMRSGSNWPPRLNLRAQRLQEGLLDFDRPLRRCHGRQIERQERALRPVRRQRLAALAHARDARIARQGGARERRLERRQELRLQRHRELPYPVGVVAEPAGIEREIDDCGCLRAPVAARLKAARPWSGAFASPLATARSGTSSVTLPSTVLAARSPLP